MAPFPYSLAVLVVFLVSYSRAFYIPGVAPSEFSMGDSLEIKVQNITMICGYN